MRVALLTTSCTSLALAFLAVFFSFQLTGLEASPQVAIPTGIKLPPELLGQVIPTSNPYIPNRPENLPPSPVASPTQQSRSTFEFIMRDFLIIIGGVLGFLGLIVFVLMIWRCIKGDPDLTKQWEKEQEALNRRTTEGLARHKKWFKKVEKDAEKKETDDLKLEFSSD